MGIHTDNAALTSALGTLWDQKTKPPGSLGRLEEVGIRYGILQNSLHPTCSHPMLLIFAADHGIAKEGVSAYPQGVTAKMVQNFLQGAAASTIMAQRLGADWRVVDCGVDGDFGENKRLIQGKIAYGTQNFVCESAMTEDQAKEAFSLGRKTIVSLNSQGSNTFFMGEMGIGNTSSAALLTHFLTKVPLDSVVGRGTGLSDKGWLHKKAVLKKAADRTQDLGRDPWKILSEYGGFEVAAMAGAYMGCFETRSMAVADGFISSVAALVAATLDKRVLDVVLWSHVSEEPGHGLLMEYLEQKPLLSLGLRLGEGTGALLGLPIIHCALDLMAKMATMEQFSIAKSSLSQGGS